MARMSSSNHGHQRSVQTANTPAIVVGHKTLIKWAEVRGQLLAGPILVHRQQMFGVQTIQNPLRLHVVAVRSHCPLNCRAVHHLPDTHTCTRNPGQKQHTLQSPYHTNARGQHNPNKHVLFFCCNADVTWALQCIIPQ